MAGHHRHGSRRSIGADFADNIAALWFSRRDYRDGLHIAFVGDALRGHHLFRDTIGDALAGRTADYRCWIAHNLARIYAKEGSQAAFIRPGLTCILKKGAPNA